MANDDPHEGELEGRQGNLYPVGRALRRTFDAENHDSLGTDLTGLMLELARIDPEATTPGRGAMPLPAPVPAPVPPSPPTDASPPPPLAAAARVQAVAAPRSWWRAMMDRLLA